MFKELMRSLLESHSASESKQKLDSCTQGRRGHPDLLVTRHMEIRAKKTNVAAWMLEEDIGTQLNPRNGKALRKGFCKISASGNCNGCTNVIYQFWISAS